MRLINGRYELRELVGKGGMAEVWEAWDRRLRRQVAVKVLDAGSLPTLEQDELRSQERFEREALIAARMNSPRIVMVHDAGVFVENGRRSPFLVMEFILGENLRQHMRSPENWYAPPLLRILADALDGLTYAHSKEIVHRDIKPENIMICRDGSAKLADFGIAIEMRENFNRLTREHHALGTQPYAAPEYLRYGKFTQLSDVYSFAVVCTEVLEHAYAPDPLPPPLKAVLDKALAQDPRGRYQSATEFQHFFRQAITTPVRRQERAPQPERAPEPQRVPQAERIPQAAHAPQTARTPATEQTERIQRTERVPQAVGPAHTSMLTHGNIPTRTAEPLPVDMPATAWWGIFVRPTLEFRQRVLAGLSRDDPRYVGGVLAGAVLAGIAAGFLVFLLFTWLVVTVFNHL
ncbi:protein kinase [Nocardia sp. NPDC020380]|uniref:serine/threonine-protein kinase n=1 Tax=Nocardia sp. NPDC020380 TaxID=3364309 RepID=UPI0037A93764